MLTALAGIRKVAAKQRTFSESASIPLVVGSKGITSGIFALFCALQISSRAQNASIISCDIAMILEGSSSFSPLAVAGKGAFELSCFRESSLGMVNTENLW